MFCPTATRLPARPPVHPAAHGSNPWVNPWVDPWVRPMGSTHGSTHGFDPWVRPMGSTHGFEISPTFAAAGRFYPRGRTHGSNPWVRPMGSTHGFDPSNLEAKFVAGGHKFRRLLRPQAAFIPGFDPWVRTHRSNISKCQPNMYFCT